MGKKGIPRSSANIFYKQYKKAKTEYRKTQRRAVWEYERKEFDDIANSTELDHEKFWKLITNPQVVSDFWANYYEKLATPPEKLCEPRRHET